MARRKTFGTHEVHAPWWETHELVVIKDLASEDDDWISDQTSTMTAGEADMSIKWGTARRVTLLRGIVSWTFTDEHSQPIPFPPFSEEDGEVLLARLRALGRLAPEDSNYIYQEINKRNQPMSDAEKKSSSKTASPGSGEKEKGTSPTRS